MPGNPGDPDGDDSGATADAGTPPSDGAQTVTLGVGPYFATPMFFNRDVSAVPKAANSASLIAGLVAAGGWGNGNKMQIDFGLDVLTANASTPRRTFTPTDDFFSPDCDHTAIPVPTGGNLEGETGYICTTDGDCHLLVFDTSARKLYEMWRANITSSTVFLGGCLAVR